MKRCPVCHEAFENQRQFCTRDNAPLGGVVTTGSLVTREVTRENSAVGNATGPLQGTTSPRSTRPARQGPVVSTTATPPEVSPQSVTLRGASPSVAMRRPDRDVWKIAFFVLLGVVVAGGTTAGYFVINRQPEAVDASASSIIADDPAETEDPALPLVVEKPSSLGLVSSQELREMLPSSLMRQFHPGEVGQGTPDDLRIIPFGKVEFVVMLGAGAAEAGARNPVERILILKYEGGAFRDSTRVALPAAYSSGLIGGRGASVKFDDRGTSIIVRDPRAFTSVINECASCERANQEIRLEWKGGRYVESERAWANDRYTAFYVAAEALDKKTVDIRARPLIDAELDPVIAQGFPHNGNGGWTVEMRAEDSAETATYDLTNSFDRIAITVQRIDGHWRAVQIGL